MHKKILELNPSFNPYDWHKPGIDSRDVLDPAHAGREVLDALEKRSKVSLSERAVSSATF